MAKRLLKARGVEFEELNLDGDPTFRERLVEQTGRSTVPQILIDGECIGGYTELRELERGGGLRALGTSA